LFILLIIAFAKVAVDSKDGGHVGEEYAQDDDNHANAGIPE
jgi:hypothetical protein